MQNLNVVRLRILMQMFRIQQKDIRRAVGCSKALVSRLLGDPTFRVREKFWIRLNSKVLELIATSAPYVFDVPATSVQDVETVEMTRPGGTTSTASSGSSSASSTRSRRSRGPRILAG